MFKFDPNSTIAQGRWRLRSPSEFSRMWTRHDVQARGISYIVGLLKTEGKLGIQSIRFDRTIWTEKKAATWWKKNKSRFKKYWTEEDWKKRWKEPKKKKVGLTSKRRKNPHADERYIYLLENAAHFGNPHYLSKALAYYNMGDKCDACDLSYEMCQCEGSREHKFDAAGNVIQGYCKQCTTDYCICDYNIFNEDDSINAEKVKWAAKGLANRTLNFNQLKEFNRLLEIHSGSYWRSISQKKLF